MSFGEKLAAAVARTRSLLCIGLDPDPARLPVADPLIFCREIIAATRDLACCYKPNAAFFEQYGAAGFAMLEQLRLAIPPETPALLDAKRGDIGSSSAAYARAVFDVLGYDAVTVSPYLGSDGVAPFLERPDCTAFILCRTSNPGAADLQELRVARPDGVLRPLYEIVAELARSWNRHGNVGLVVGATAPAELSTIRRLCPDQPILVPGIGVQGGEVARAVAAGRAEDPSRLLITVSRAVLYASSGGDWLAAARRAAERYHAEIAAAAGLTS
ncbi:MAG: orotidine 5'-phosphate decarboxylase [Dehalococcoidia bacterium]|nr:MAG: orotidine 5'-phosphate decarboxylase [Dehalococcoidia bacterium]